MKELTIGQTSGFTGISHKRIRDYLADYGSFFSPTATTKTKKRFTTADIKTLLLIHQMGLDHQHKPAILAALEAGPDAPGAAQYELSGLLALARKAESLAESASKNLGAINFLRQEVAALRAEVKALQEAQGKKDKSLFGILR